VRVSPNLEQHDQRRRTPRLAELRNHYFVMRHAQSRPNVEGLIVCRPPAGLDPVNGLTQLGRAQARQHAQEWLAGRDGAPPIIVSSDFSRTAETADILAHVVGSGRVVLDARLRERDFGPYDGGPATAYDEIWAFDATGDTAPGVEPTDAVQARVLQLVGELESTHAGLDIVLVSHGDTSQITQATFANLPTSEHRSLPHLGNAEIRALNSAPADQR
jgi:probable phosphoglycerate mutase